MWKKNVLGYTCGVVFADKHFSELGNKICQRHPEIDFCAMIDMDGTISYRTVRDDINLGADIAKMFGGGGHAKAAGSRFSDEMMRLSFIPVLDVIHSSLVSRICESISLFTTNDG